MSIIINGVNIPNNGDFIKYNGTNIEKVVCNGIEVWKKQKDITLTPTNHHGLTVTGLWARSYESYRGDLDGETYSIEIENVDLTSYNKIRCNIEVTNSVTTSNGGSITVKLVAGGSSNSKVVGRVYAEYDPDEPGRGNSVTENAVVELNVSGVTGQRTVYIDMKLYHGTNHVDEGNLIGRYSVKSIEFLSQ